MEVSSVQPSCRCPEGGDYENRASGATYSIPPNNPIGDKNLADDALSKAPYNTHIQSSDNAHPCEKFEPSPESTGHCQIHCCHRPNQDHFQSSPGPINGVSTSHDTGYNNHDCDPDHAPIADASITPVRPTLDSPRRPSSQQSRHSTVYCNESSPRLHMNQQPGYRPNNSHRECEERPILGSTLESASSQYQKPVEAQSERSSLLVAAKQSEYSQNHYLESASKQLNVRPESCHRPTDFCQPNTVRPSDNLQSPSSLPHNQLIEETALRPPSALKFKEEPQGNVQIDFQHSLSTDMVPAVERINLHSKTSKEQDTVASLMIPEYRPMTPSYNTSSESHSGKVEKFNPASLTHLNFKDKQLALSAIKKAASNMSCVQMFQDKDKSNIGKIGRRDFQIVMDKIGVLNDMSSREIDAVFKGFATRTETELDYKRFIAACSYVVEGGHTLARTAKNLYMENTH